jgi:hypothetical protein
MTQHLVDVCVNRISTDLTMAGSLLINVRRGLEPRKHRRAADFRRKSAAFPLLPGDLQPSAEALKTAECAWE